MKRTAHHGLPVWCIESEIAHCSYFSGKSYFMSTYTYRFYEVRIPIIDQYVQQIDNEKGVDLVPDKPLYNGYTIRLWSDHEYPFRIWDEDKKEWTKHKNCRKEWKLCKWLIPYKKGEYKPQYTLSHISDAKGSVFSEGDKLRECYFFCNNGGVVRDEFISDHWLNNEKCGFVKRGFPDDMTNDLKKAFKEDKDLTYTWGHTYVMLSEWENVLDKKIAEFRKRLEEKMDAERDKTVEQMLSIILKKLDKPDYKIPKAIKKNKEDEEESYYEDTVDYIWGEEFTDILTINEEIMRAMDIVSEFSYASPEDIRIVYYLA